MDRVAIGQRCEKLWRAACRKNAEAALATATKTIAVEWDKANAILVAERKAWLASDNYDRHCEEVEFALQTDQRLADSKAPARVITVTPRRPKGLRDSIIRQVAADESAKRGGAISLRTVRTCWDEYRELERDLASDV